MLYRIFKWLFTTTVRVYFRTISVKGSENIPKSGPVVFVANHNSAFMDPILLAVHIKRPLYFLARGESFTSVFISKFFNQLHMIPIYRPEVCPDKVHKNKKVFEDCYQHLTKGKTLLIFPEGFSKTVRDLRPLKTGTARMSLEAEKRNDFHLGVQVIPIGINYSNPHRFRSQVFLNIGEPLNVKTYKEVYHSKPKEAVLNFTADLEKWMESLLVVIKDEKIYTLVEQIETLNFNILAPELGQTEKGEQRFALSKEIVNIIKFYNEFNNEKLKDFQRRIGDYFEKLKLLKIKDTQLNYSNTKHSHIGNLLYLILAAPVFIYGLLVNIIPFSMLRILSSRIKVREDFVGSKKLALGMFSFLIFYIFQSMLLGWITQWYWAVLFILSFFPSGLVCLDYLKRFNSLKHEIQLNVLSKEGIKIFKELKLERTRLLHDWAGLKESYLQSRNP